MRQEFNYDLRKYLSYLFLAEGVKKACWKDVKQIK